jgi:hypothetical protein
MLCAACTLRGQRISQEEHGMKRWKWMALIATSGIMVQFSACAVDAGYYLLQILASNYLPQLLDQLLGGNGAAAEM